MKRIFCILAAMMAACHLPAQFAYEMKDGSVIESPDALFRQTADGTMTVGGIGIEHIERIRRAEHDTPVALGSKLATHAYVLDMNDRNNEREDDDTNSRNLYSAEYMLQVAGIPYVITTDLDEALHNARFLLLSSRIRAVGSGTSFSEDEFQRIHDWVDGGGILVAPAIETNNSAACFRLFGITHRTSGKDHSLIEWDGGAWPELAYFDEPEELTTTIGQKYITATSYDLQDALPIAHYEDGKVAATCHRTGRGAAYTVGVRWRDAIQRAHLNKDAANRGSSDTFEPSADMYSLLLRGVYAANTPVALWKNTVPGVYESVLIPTHDCDSRTAYDEMHWISDYEASIGLRSHFFITVHYFRHPGYMSAFYCDETIPAVRALIANGHTVGSHSICHFPDFSTTSRFPLTETTREEYAATVTHDPETKTTTGGSTWAEIVMSKQIIEEDLGIEVKSFRSGHLCVNTHFPAALTQGGYSFASCYTASDVMNSFPYFVRMDNAWTGQLTNVLQIPLHFSDVFKSTGGMNEQNWTEKPALWYNISNKLMGNYSPLVLLIHPNRDWKMFAQRSLTDMLDRRRVGLYNFEDYGTFWLRRLALDYEAWYDEAEGQIVIQAKADDIQRSKDVNIVVETKEEVKRVVLIDENGKIHATRQRSITPTRYAVAII